MQRDTTIFNLIEQEKARQSNGIELIASENFTSPAVMEACGSVLTNKYAEGYPGKRYYGGCEVVDEVETHAIERAKSLFGAVYANVQPHSGSQANTAVFHAFLKPGDKILGFDNIPGAVPMTSTNALNNTTLPFVQLLAKKGWKDACAQNEALKKGLSIYDGKIVHAPVANTFDLPLYENVI